MIANSDNDSSTSFIEENQILHLIKRNRKLIRWSQTTF